MRWGRVARAARFTLAALLCLALVPTLPGMAVRAAGTTYYVGTTDNSAQVTTGCTSATNTTLASNTATASGASGGGIFDDSAALITLKNTLVVNNTHGNVGSASLSGSSANNDTSDGAGVSTTLAFNGGPTLTLSIVTGGPAYQNGDLATCEGLSSRGINGITYTGSTAIDQRGVPRIVNGKCSIGAYEPGQVQTFTTLATSATSANYGQAVTLTATVFGVFGDYPGNDGTVAFTNGVTLIPNCTAQPISGGVATCTTSALPAGGIAAPLNALLAPLGSDGGPTQTVALLPGSPAIDTGPCPTDPTTTMTLNTDGRGIGRPKGVSCDSGAFELQGFAFTGVTGNGQSATVTTDFATPLALSVTSGHSEPVSGGAVTFTITPSAARDGASAAFEAPGSTGCTIGTNRLTAICPVSNTGGTTAPAIKAGLNTGNFTVVARTAGVPPSGNVTYTLTNTSSAELITPQPMPKAIVTVASGAATPLPQPVRH